MRHPVRILPVALERVNADLAGGGRHVGVEDLGHEEALGRRRREVRSEAQLEAEAAALKRRVHCAREWGTGRGERGAPGPSSTAASSLRSASLPSTRTPSSGASMSVRSSLATRRTAALCMLGPTAACERNDRYQRATPVATAARRRRPRRGWTRASGATALCSMTVERTWFTGADSAENTVQLWTMHTGPSGHRSRAHQSSWLSFTSSWIKISMAVSRCCSFVCTSRCVSRMSMERPIHWWMSAL